ncbi:MULTISPECIES: DUF7118 family protein [Haloferax]|uniref:Uncharacterized protein n=1 Tax=Haloferax sp. Atlit-48N TaxID=2077198 RepID=A0ACD5I4F5_9EURY|nr:MULTISPECIES: hypothetical protein [Haloferax]MBC9987744.1 hypothetical protein [Haloferax sp. AS1]RDZ30512.1 hypothetical protein DEQ67_13135 [Haloferax sp. Atlit-48N]RDZ33553.1 hypothetical protein C5B88_17305 [Haloferax sp. Atlit-24N]RDZ35862.1 hypothetical protein C5B89_16570 [Haloferax sp. Atlit-47N]RLM34339.1 hypothetical protein DVK03_17475 [Haloferax sp. Atlit-109R]
MTDAALAADDVAALRTAADTLRGRREAVDDIGREELRTLASAVRDVTGILDRYEERATDDLEGYVEFREALSDRLEEVPADVRHSDAFIDANESLTTGITSSLSASDFEQARRELDPAREEAALLDELDEARDDYRSARRRLRERADELDARIDRLERVRELGEADIDAPVDELRDPIERYDDAVTEAFDRFRAKSSAREVLAWLAAAESYPLVGTPSPPERLREYLETAAIGDETIPTLVEYAGYSRSKLDHYVDDPKRFAAAVGTNKRFLETLDADPLTVSWPPDPAAELRWRTKELVAVVSRFAADETVARAREVHELTYEESYDRLRDAAVARAELTEDQRERLQRGVVEEELADAREERERVADCLDANPPLDD